VEIDENLDWKLQVNSVIKKISKGNYLLWRHKKKLSTAMKKVVYESFVRCHLLYGITIWGGAANVILKPLEKLLSKIWNKIGQSRMHTLNRLQKYGLFKFKDELRLQESKLLWKWEKEKIPSSLKNIVTERVDNLRGRRFNLNRLWKDNSISSRLANRANGSINTISLAKSKVSLINKLKKEISTSYLFDCRIRNCFICGNRNL
jgi:hypothetical protein